MAYPGHPLLIESIYTNSMITSIWSSSNPAASLTQAIGVEAIIFQLYHYIEGIVRCLNSSYIMLYTLAYTSFGFYYMDKEYRYNVGSARKFCFGGAQTSNSHVEIFGHAHLVGSQWCYCREMMENGHCD